jgi:exodeoxyribonuclease III
MLRIITVNVNGIRSAASKGFFDWLATQNADVVCLQEIKAQPGDLTELMRNPPGLHGYFHCANKKGYSGVGIYCREKPKVVIEGIEDAEFDAEGRYIEADFDGLSVVSLYLPSGSSSPERQEAKFRFLERFEPRLIKMREAGKEIVLCGDWNIAHKEIDLKNWRSNQKNSGFLPEERAWLTRVFDEIGWVDVFRTLNREPDQYTWWSNRGQAWAKNVGWRIDYHIATGGIAAKARQAEIYTAQRFSDHAPLTIDYAD